MIASRAKLLLLDYIKKGDRSQPIGLVVCIAIVASLALVDFTIGLEIKSAPLYIVGSFVIAWFSPKKYLWMFLMALLALRMRSFSLESINSNIEFAYLIAGYITQVASILFVYASVFVIRRLVVELAETAHGDPLTEIFSRRYLIDVMPVIIGELKRHNRPLGVMFLDCDNFKQVNDNLGHAAGDAVLRVVAKTILQTVRVGDIPVRLGGDEFLVMFMETSGLELRVVVNRCIERLNSEMRNRDWPITFSVGVVEFSTVPGDLCEIISVADDAMYSSKKSGKNTITFREI